MNKPRFTIITVCYNAERTIAETIESVLCQTLVDFEYLIIDGASIDRTTEIVNRYNDPRISLNSELDQGLYDAINKGIAKAKGELICILHADDRLANAKTLESVNSFFLLEPKLEAVSTSVHIFKESNLNKPYRIYKASKFKKWQFRLGMQPPHPGFFIKKEALDKVGYYRIQYKISGDFEWLLRGIWIKQLQVKYSDLVSVFMRDGGISSSGWKSRIKMNKENLKILKSHHIYSNKVLLYSKYLFKIFQLRRF